MSPHQTLSWGAIAGTFGLVGLILLYPALAAGSMSIVAPTIGVLAAVIPVAWDIALGREISSIQWIGIALAISAVVLLASHQAETALTGRVLAQSVGAAVAFAGFVIAMSHTDPASGLWPLASARTVSIILGTIVLGTTSTLNFPDRRLLRLIAFIGINAVISSLYPALTVLAALIILKECPGHTQVAGIALAVVSVLLLALCSNY
jgi:uncharacterized membrane protein